MAELVGDHALKLVSRKSLECSSGDTNHGIGWFMASREGIDALLVIHDINGRNRYSGGEGHFFHDIEQAFFERILDILSFDQTSTQRFGDDRPA